MLLYLASNETWKTKATAEVQHLVGTYTSENSFDPIHQRLSTIPITAWEDNVPVLENVIRETLRLVQNGTALRRNLVNGLQVSGKPIKKGTFMAYSLADVHLNGNIYSDPLKFDPDRFNAPREEDKHGEMLFLGWGAGRHPCGGQFIYLFFFCQFLNFLYSLRYESCKTRDESDDGLLPGTL